MIDSFEKIASLSRHIETEVHKIELAVREKTSARETALIDQFAKRVKNREFGNTTPDPDHVEEIRKYEVHEKKLKDVQVLAAELAEACENLKVESPLPAVEKSRGNGKYAALVGSRAEQALIQYALKFFTANEFKKHNRHAIAKELGCNYHKVSQVFVELTKKGVLEHNGGKLNSAYRIKRLPNYAVARAGREVELVTEEK